MDWQELPSFKNPCCGETNWDMCHQKAVHLFNRKEDEEVEGIRIDQVTGKITLSSLKNPSLRRQGLIIEFYCEGCLTDFLFSIYQHKGETKQSFIKNYSKSQKFSL